MLRPYFTSIVLFDHQNTVAIYWEKGNNEDFWKTQTLIVSSKFIKFYIPWSKIVQFEDDLTMFRAMKFKRSFFSLISTNFGKFPHADITKDQQMLIMKFVSDGIKKCIRNCKNTLKKSFWNTFFCQKLSWAKK